MKFISSLVLAAVMCRLGVALAASPVIYVDNIKGDDRSDGSREKPLASIEKACRMVKTSGRIEVVNTGKPYQLPYDGPGKSRGLRLLVGGTKDAPLVVEGNGAVISGLAVIPSGAWTEAGPRLYSLPFDPMSNVFRRDLSLNYWLPGTQIWFVDGKAAPNLLSREELEKTPNGFWWNKKERKVLYHLPEGRKLDDVKIELPANYGFYIHQDHTIVRNFTMMFSWNDGFDAAEAPKDSAFINCLAYNSCGQGMSIHDVSSIYYLNCGAVNCASSSVCNTRQSSGVYKRCAFINNTFEAAVFLSDDSSALFDECLIADPEPAELIWQQRRSSIAFFNCILIGNKQKNLARFQAGTLSFSGCTILNGAVFCTFAPKDAFGSISVRQSILGNFSDCYVELPAYPNAMRVDLSANRYMRGTGHRYKKETLIPGKSELLAKWKIDDKSILDDVLLTGHRNSESPSPEPRRSLRIGAKLPASVWEIYDRLKNYEATPAGIVRKKG